MRRPTKGEVCNAALWGRVDASDVVAVSRDKHSVRYRHAWPEDTDARAWHAISRAAMTAARELARKTGACVEVYSYNGCLLEQCYPEK